MKTTYSRSLTGLASEILPICFLIVFSWQCTKPDQPFTPVAYIQATPQNANTTQTLDLKANVSNLKDAGGDLFFRWDWDGNLTWDTRYSTSSATNHRYYAPGEHLVHMQILTLRGDECLFDTVLIIARGFSAPKPAFTVTPDSGNFKTTFVFDCSTTRDDEDSTNTLLFRWDIENDGYFETVFSKNPLFNFHFTKPGKYPVLLEVKDPSGLTAHLIKELNVNSIDTLIKPDFIWKSLHNRVADTFFFDARASAYSGPDHRILSYQWLFPHAPNYSPLSENPEIPFAFISAGYQKVTLRVSDQYGLYNTLTRDIMVSQGNDPPKAVIRVAIAYGNINNPMYFDSWLCTDDFLSPSKIAAQWDFDGDGTWDTPMSTQKEYNHQYTQPGTYWVMLRIEDDGGNNAEATQRVIISPWSNKLGIFQDGRDGQLYGTVQIGEQTWMAENLKYFIPLKDRKGTMTPMVFFNQNSKNIQDYGIYYNFRTSIMDRQDVIQYDICPTGWRLPTKNDWEILILKLRENDAGTSLAFGGSADFNGKFVGYVDWTSKSPGDTVYTFKETYKQAWFISSDEYPADLRVDGFLVKVKRDSAAIWSGYEQTKYFMSVRCIKN